MLKRKLSQYEQFYRKRTQAEAHRGFFVAATYKRELTIPVIFHALQATLKEVPILACNVTKADDGEYWYKAFKHPLSHFLEIESEDVMTEDGGFTEEYMALTKYHRWPIYTDQALMRLVKVGKNTLLACFEHLINDGVGGRFFHEVFAKHLGGEIDESVTLDSIVFDPELPHGELPPAADDFMAYPKPGDAVTIGRKCPEDQPLWPGRYPSTRVYLYAYKYFHFSPEEVDAVLKRCREEKTLLTAYMEGVINKTILPLTQNMTTSFCTAIHLRRFMPGCDELIQVAASLGIPEFYAPGQDFSWDRCRAASDNLKKDSANPNLMQGMQKWVDYYAEHGDVDCRPFFDAGQGTGKFDTVKLSNLGVCKLPEISNMFFYQDLMPTMSEFMINCVLSTEGGLNFVWMYFNHRRKEEVEEALKSFRTNFIECAKTK